MKELIEKIENREEFFLKLLEKFLRKNVDDLLKNEIEIKEKTYVFLFSQKNQTVIIDGVFKDGLNPVLNAEKIVKQINKKLNLSVEEIVQTTYIGSYVDNLDFLNLRAFKFENLSPCGSPSGINFMQIYEFSKNQIQKILEGENNVH